jgi:hypothetical protein
MIGAPYARRCAVIDRATVPADFLQEYLKANCTLVDSDPEFATWLATEYRPIEGGWQY